MEQHNRKKNKGRGGGGGGCWVQVICALLLLYILAAQFESLARNGVDNVIASGDGILWNPLQTTTSDVELLTSSGLTTRRASAKEPSSSFEIIILTMNRFDSLNRLIQSLQASDYLQDKVDLVIRFDRPKIVTSEWLAQVAAFKDSLQWTAGTKTVVMATENMGLRKAWLTAWQPTSTDDRAIIFEDDISVSPVWYKWLRGAEHHYRNRTDIAGLSLQRQNLVPLKSARNNHIPDNDSHPFLYKLVGSIGYAPRASVWRDFLDFAHCALETKLSVATPELVTSDWYQQLDQRTMWTQLFIYYAKHMDLYTLYQFPKQQRALAAHWRERGEHFAATGGKDFELAAADDESGNLVYPTDLPKLGWDARPVVEPPKSPSVLLRSVVMSGAVGYDAKTFERFCKSLRQHYSGDVVLLVSNDLTPDIQRLITLYHIQTVPTLEKGGVRASKGWSKINHERWNFYESTCQADKYDLCMAVDFRDVLFQDDPFRNMRLQEGAVAHVYEHNLKMNNWHLQETSRCKQGNEAMKNKMIINAGGFVGTPAAFPQLSSLVLNMTGMGCDDQVAFNLAIHGKMSNVTIHAYKQGEGSINNVAWGGVYRRDGRQRFLNRNCFPAPAVHQFDIVQ